MCNFSRSRQKQSETSTKEYKKKENIGLTVNMYLLNHNFFDHKYLCNNYK